MKRIQRRRYCRRCQEHTLHEKKGTSHLVHFLLTCVTVFWVFCWIIAGILNTIAPFRCQKCGSSI